MPHLPGQCCSVLEPAIHRASGSARAAVDVFERSLDFPSLLIHEGERVVVVLTNGDEPGAALPVPPPPASCGSRQRPGRN